MSTRGCGTTLSKVPVLHPLLEAACARHGIPDAAVVPLGRDGTGDPFAVRGDGGETIESLDQLRHHAGLPRRWQPLVVGSTLASPRERAVDELVRRGYATAAIAAELGVSPRTVTGDRARLRKHAVSAERALDDSKVCVVGRPSLARDLVHDCLIDADVGVAPSPGSRPSASVVVAVRPSAREFDVRPGARIVACGLPPDSVGLAGAIRRGLVAVLPADPTPAEVLDAVRRALEGSISFPPAVVEQLVDELYGRDSGAVVLSDRDRDMLTAIRAGESMKQTARRLGISPKTVENLRRQLYQKLGARSAAEAVALAARNGANTPPQSADSSTADS